MEKGDRMISRSTRSRVKGGHGYAARAIAHPDGGRLGYGPGFRLALPDRSLLLWNGATISEHRVVTMDTYEAPGPDITRFLAEAAGGDAAASERVWSSLYGELRRLARVKLNGERADHTLSTTALVHEAYVKLVDGVGLSASDRHHFLAVAARAMRQILVDHARRRSRLKRGSRPVMLPLDEARDRPLDPDRDPELFIALDEAVTRLGLTHERLARVVELRFYGGLGPEETAEVLGATRRTVERDWGRARAYLYRLLVQEAEPSEP